MQQNIQFGMKGLLPFLCHVAPFQQYKQIIYLANLQHKMFDSDGLIQQFNILLDAICYQGRLIWSITKL